MSRAKAWKDDLAVDEDVEAALAAFLDEKELKLVGRCRIEAGELEGEFGREGCPTHAVEKGGEIGVSRSVAESVWSFPGLDGVVGLEFEVRNGCVWLESEALDRYGGGATEVDGVGEGPACFG